MTFRARFPKESAPAPCAARRRQVAALCVRAHRDGPQVLLITSRGTGRWILPKGWPITGLADHDAALQEAWEEAGVRRADISPRPVGSYEYVKLLKNGASAPVEARVFRAEVTELSDRFPERGQRRRRWFDPADAAERVAEPRLRALLQHI